MQAVICLIALFLNNSCKIMSLRQTSGKMEMTTMNQLMIAYH